MKRRKKLTVLAAVLAAALVVTVCVAMIDRKTEQIKEFGATVLEIPADRVDSLSWEYQGNPISLTKGEQWQMDDDEAFPVSQAAMDELLSGFEEVGAAFCIENVEDYGQYGLEKPACTIRLAAGDESWEIKLGAFSKMDQQRYADIGDGNVYLLVEDPMDQFDQGRAPLMQHDEMPQLESADRIEFAGQQNYAIVHDPENGKSFREDDHYYAELDGALEPVDSLSIESYLGKFSKLKLDTDMTYTAGEDDLSVYGLDAPELTITVTYTDESGQKTDSLAISRDPAEVADLDEDETATPKAYARLNNSEIVYLLTSTDYENLAACGFDDLRHQEIFPADIGLITEIDAVMDDAAYTLTTDPDASKQQFQYEGLGVDASAITDSLSQIRASEFTDEPGSGKVELRLDVALSTGDALVLEFQRMDSESSLAVLNGQTLAKVPRSQVVQLREDINSVVLRPAEETE